MPTALLMARKKADDRLRGAVQRQTRLCFDAMTDCHNNNLDRHVNKHDTIEKHLLHHCKMSNELLSNVKLIKQQDRDKIIP